MSSIFEKVAEAPPDSIFGLNLAFKADPATEKLNIVVGAYRTEEGNPLVLHSVKKAEDLMLQSKDFNKEYLPIDGYPEFNKASGRLLFGGKIADSLGKKLVTVQALSGTGSLKLAADFIKRFLPNATVYISDPTWPNHMNIFNFAGVPNKKYRYFDSKTNTLDFEGMKADIMNAPEGSVILYHACAHNPTGTDPTIEQWEMLANIMKEKKLVTLFDCAYQGFATGDLERDGRTVRLFVEKGLELICCQSFAKNCGLYGERVGAINVVCASENSAVCVLSQLKAIARANYSNPPIHGAYIVALLLTRPELVEEWKVELRMMADRIQLMRQMLYDDLKSKGIDWSHIMNQIGMFAFTGMTAKQVEQLKTKHHIYLTSDGRISLPGLSTKTVPMLAKAIFEVVSKESDSKL